MAIDPERLYSLTEAARLVPSPHADKSGVHPDSLKRYVRAGLLRAVYRTVIKKRLWFFRGSELLRFLAAGEPPAVEAERSQQDTDRGLERARRVAEKEFGIVF